MNRRTLLRKVLHPLVLGAALLTAGCGGSRTAVNLDPFYDGGANDAWPTLDAIVGADSGRQIFNQLAFVSNRDGNYELYVLDVELGVITRITNHPALDSRPSWSPDGKQLVYSHNDNGEWSIYVVLVDGSIPPRKITEGIEAEWSPGGEKIAYVSQKEGNVELYLTDVEGTPSVRITKNGIVGTDFSWSNDGRRIVYKVDNADLNQGYGLAVFDLEERMERRLPDTKTELNAVPRWCPDHTIVYHSTVNGNRDVYRTGIGWPEPQRLTDHPLEGSFPSCSPDGSKIAFQSNGDGNLDVYVMQLDGIILGKISNNLLSDGLPQWSKDGTQIAYGCSVLENEQEGLNSEICMAYSNGTNVRNLTKNPAYDFDFVIKP